jgi:hypothetical protein
VHYPKPLLHVLGGWEPIFKLPSSQNLHCSFDNDNLLHFSFVYKLCVMNKPINTHYVQHDKSVSRVYICLDTQDIVTLPALSKCYSSVDPQLINIQYWASLPDTASFLQDKQLSIQQVLLSP